MRHLADTNTSIWTLPSPSPDTPVFPVLETDLHTDVVVVGGGITGLLTALHLSDAGQRVVLIDAGQIARRNTGLSTGNLYTAVSNMSDLSARWGGGVVGQVRALRAGGIRTIERAARRLALDCGFGRVPMFYGIEHDANNLRVRVEQEMLAYQRAGLTPSASRGGLPFALASGFRVEGQAQFDPYRFCLGLAAHLGRRIPVFESTPAVDVDASEGCVMTPGGRIHARHIVLATHSPAGFNLVQAEMEVYRECGIAVRVADPPAPGIHWIKDSERSLRAAVAATGEQWLIAVGGKHQVGEQHRQQEETQRLDAYVRERFQVTGDVIAWSAQQFKPADGLPYIGGSAHDNVWVATGFQADGLVWGAVAAQLITEGIAEVHSDAARLLSPLRITPMKSAKGWARTNATVIRHLVGDRIKREMPTHVDEVNSGCGALVERDGQRQAIYRDPQGQLHALSPVCPHMKCLVQWNDPAKSWDCPCHGSRFAPTGELLEGPAMTGLRRLAPEGGP